MQVFVPYTTLKASVCCLDDSRLGNQVYREALTLLRGGWAPHPAAIMWRDYKDCLAKYCLYGLIELYVERSTISKQTFKEHWKTFCGYLNVPSLYSNQKETTKSKDPSLLITLKNGKQYDPLKAKVLYPWWWGDTRVHLSHQAALLYKNEEWYSQFNWNTPPAIPNAEGSLPYYWPTL